MICEPRPPRLGGARPLVAAALAHIRVGGPGLAQVLRHQPAVGVEHLAVPQRDRGARGGSHLQFDDPGEVLPHVEDEHARADLLHRLRCERHRHPHRLGCIAVDHLRLHEAKLTFLLHARLEEGRFHGARVSREHGVVPHGGVGLECGRVPPRQFAAGVVHLAHEEVGLTDRPLVGHLPRCIGDHALPRAVGIFDVELAEERGRLAVDVPPGLVRTVPHKEAVADVARIPAVGHGRAEAMPRPRLGFLERRRHVVRPRGHPLTVVGPPGLELMVADAPPIERPRHEPQGRAVKHGLLHRLHGGKRLPVVPRGGQVEPRRVGVQQRGIGRADPRALPLRLVEEAGHPRGDTAPRRLLAIVIPHHRFPEHALPARERLPRILDAERFARCHAAGVPEIGRAGREQLGARRGENPIGRLPLAAFPGEDHPREPRRSRHEPLRLLAPLAAETSGHDPRLRPAIGRERARPRVVSHRAHGACEKPGEERPAALHHSTLIQKGAAANHTIVETSMICFPAQPLAARHFSRRPVPPSECLKCRFARRRRLPAQTTRKSALRDRLGILSVHASGLPERRCAIIPRKPEA